MNEKTQEFYKRLKVELTNTSLWPTEYLYKFVVPTDTEKIKRVENIFDNMGAVIKTNHSKTGKYTSISINVKMKNPDAVIEKYIEVSEIEGIISI
ncbi:MAG: DUF493 family protein [Flavobacteriaceae bacterium]